VAGRIRKRPDRGPNTWQLRVYVGRDSNGRIRHRSHTFQGSKRAAEKELARLVLAQDAAPQVVPDEASRPWGPTTTINDAISGWKANGWDDLSPVTSRRYESIWKLHIENAIGKKRIASLSPYDVDGGPRQDDRPLGCLDCKVSFEPLIGGNLRSQVVRARLSRRQDGPVSAYAWTFNNLGCMAHTARVCVAVRDRFSGH
jgi:hypothetical protein